MPPASPLPFETLHPSVTTSYMLGTLAAIKIKNMEKMKKKIDCRLFKKKSKTDSENVINCVKEYNCIFFKQFLIGFVIVLLLTFVIGHFYWFSHLINIKCSDKEFEIITTIIVFLGILLGFLMTALGIMISGVQNRFSNEKDTDKQAMLNDYWEYLVKISKTVILFLLIYILIFIVCITQIPTIRQYNAQIYLVTWCVLSTILICYLVFDRIFDYYRNPFEK